MPNCSRCGMKSKRVYCPKCKALYDKKYKFKNKLKIMKQAKQYYQLNKIKIDEYNRTYLKTYQETIKRKNLRAIRALTRIYFPITNQKCNFCKSRAKQHHHYINPIEYDKFYFVCKKCHKIQDNKLRINRVKQKLSGYNP